MINSILENSIKEITKAFDYVIANIRITVLVKMYIAPNLENMELKTKSLNIDIKNNRHKEQKEIDKMIKLEVNF